MSSSLHMVLHRMKWQLIQALQMFVEHVVLKHEGMIKYVRQLQLVSSNSMCLHIFVPVKIPVVVRMLSYLYSF